MNDKYVDHISIISKSKQFTVFKFEVLATQKFFNLIQNVYSFDEDTSSLLIYLYKSNA